MFLFYSHMGSFGFEISRFTNAGEDTTPGAFSFQHSVGVFRACDFSQSRITFHTFSSHSLPNPQHSIIMSPSAAYDKQKSHTLKSWIISHRSLQSIIIIYRTVSTGLLNLVHM